MAMDRTIEFRALLAKAVGSGHPPDHDVREISPFMRAAGEQQRRLAQLRHRLQLDPGQKANAVQACKDEMARSQELEPLIEDSTGLKAHELRQVRQLREHRRALFISLFEDLQNLASSVQSDQISEMQHEAEVASYFCEPATALRTTMASAPPVTDDFDAQWRSGVSEAAGQPGNDALDAEAHSLLAMFANDMDQIQETQKKTQEVSALVTQFAMEVQKQQESIENVTSLADESIENIQQAEKHLQSAMKNSNSYRFYVVCWFTGSAIFLLIFDYLDSRMPI